jgi:hypothetical protein
MRQQLSYSGGIGNPDALKDSRFDRGGAASASRSKTKESRLNREGAASADINQKRGRQSAEESQIVSRRQAFVLFTFVGEEFAVLANTSGSFPSRNGVSVPAARKKKLYARGDNTTSMD